MTVVFYMKQTTGNSWCRITEEITFSTRQKIMEQVVGGDKWINFVNVNGVEYLINSDNISHFGFTEINE